MIRKRNYLFINSFILLIVILLLLIMFILSIITYICLLPPIRIISKIEYSPYVNTSNGTAHNINTVIEEKCYKKNDIHNITLLWQLGNASKVCDCHDYKNENTCTKSIGIHSKCEWRDDLCMNKIVKTCIDKSPVEGESCKMYRGFGKCSANFMVGFCCQTCFNCEC
jgi:hypothetical protein